jgi:hypothetical protein
MPAFRIATSAHLGFTPNLPGKRSIDLALREPHEQHHFRAVGARNRHPPRAASGRGPARAGTPAGLAVWRGLEAYGRAKAQRELRSLHDRWETSDPKLARRLRAADAFLVAEGKRHDA